MKATLFFDAGDTCCSYKYGDILMGHPESLVQPIDSGEYLLPVGFNPVGHTAEKLFQYALDFVSTFDTL